MPNDRSPAQVLNEARNILEIIRGDQTFFDEGPVGEHRVHEACVLGAEVLVVGVTALVSAAASLQTLATKGRFD
jgi:hypothetical protein